MEIFTPEFLDGCLWVFLVLAALLAIFVITVSFCLIFRMPPVPEQKDDRYDVSREMEDR